MWGKKGEKKYKMTLDIFGQDNMVTYSETDSKGKGGGPRGRRKS